MKKLLISTALVSSVLTGVAFSQTTITGEMRIGYKTHYDGLLKDDSQRGFGTEQQINIQNKVTIMVDSDFCDYIGFFHFLIFKHFIFYYF